MLRYDTYNDAYTIPTTLKLHIKWSITITNIVNLRSIKRPVLCYGHIVDDQGKTMNVFSSMLDQVCPTTSASTAIMLLRVIIDPLVTTVMKVPREATYDESNVSSSVAQSTPFTAYYLQRSS